MAGGAFAAYDDGRGVFGANPFADVTPDDWAYQAVSELSEEGVVSGYPDRDVPRGAECDSL